MSRLVIELTNRCTLRCLHCFDERHAGTVDLPPGIVDRVILEARSCGIEHLSFTGGEPTLYHGFHRLVQRVCRAGYTFGFVSNGATLPAIHALLASHRQSFRGVTFSLDGAREQTHDDLRGRGSYRQVMRAASICVVRDLPFTINTVLTRRNRAEVGEMVRLAERLGSGGVRFGHLMPTPETTAHGLDLSPGERRDVEAEIWQLRSRAAVPVGMAPGHYSESPFFPCAPLELDEFNLDCRGNLTLCCQLSGYSGAATGTDVAGNLHDMSLREACERFRRLVARYLADKREKVARAELDERDHFPCWYCVKYLGKARGLEEMPGSPWVQEGLATARRS
jgi:MoaA/NifB/PqqE/SkfB family radical SAM enzyme